MLMRKARELSNRMPVAEQIRRMARVRSHARRLFFRLTGYPSTVYITLSSRCNARCIFCPYPEIADSGSPLLQMSDTVFDHAVKAVESGGVERVSLTPPTGEIFTDPRWSARAASVLQLPGVKWVDFYTNAISLNEKNLDKLMQLPNREKLSIHISVGGLDRETYHELYGVDRFDKVLRNIHALLGELAARHDRTAVSIEVRLLKHQKGARVKDAMAVYNPARYAHLGVNLRWTYDSIGGMVSPDILDLIEPIGKDYSPCLRLGNTNFAPDGSVRACGCVTAERPGQNDALLLGRIDDSPELLDRRRRKMISDWRERNTVPEVCRDCTIYLKMGRWSSQPLYAPARRAHLGQATEERS